MIVLGADSHKRSHTIAALCATTGDLLGEQTVPAGAKGSAALLRWARGLGDGQVWALEDCRHVSGSLERFLIERGERVLRVHSKHGECPDGWEAAALRRHNGRDEPSCQAEPATRASRQAVPARPAFRGWDGARQAASRGLGRRCQP